MSIAAIPNIQFEALTIREQCEVILRPLIDLERRDAIKKAHNAAKAAGASNAVLEAILATGA